MAGRRLSARVERTAALLSGFIAAALGLMLLEGLIQKGVISRFVISPPSEVLASFPMLLFSEGLIDHALQTFGETFAAAALAAVIGMPVGVALDRSQLLCEACETWIAGLASAPLILLYPLFLVLFGRTALTIIVMGAISGLPAIILKTREGLGSARPVLLDVARSFNASSSQQFWKIKFPAAIPTIFMGIRLCLLLSLLAVVAVEFLIDLDGLGALISDLANRFEMPAMYGAIVSVTVVSACFFLVCEKVERWLRPV
jgi:ABC-type nitrate/sulfonate/bicarbonate transport system permease component